MSGTAHTASPWRIGLSTEDEHFLFEPGGEVVAVICGGAQIPPGERQNNATLMAAAPEMLAALRDLADTVECALDAGLFLSVDGRRPDVMALRDAVAAIAAAEGRA